MCGLAVSCTTSSHESIVRHFDFKSDPDLAEYSTDLGCEIKAAHSCRRERDEHADFAALRADFAK